MQPYFDPTRKTALTKMEDDLQKKMEDDPKKLKWKTTSINFSKTIMMTLTKNGSLTKIIRGPFIY
jgi:hypothetical protein